MTNEEREIKDKMETLKSLNEKLDDLDSILDNFNKRNEDYADYQKLMEDVSPEERIDINWNAGYSIYTLYYIYLKLQNKDPRDHEIKDEIKRVQDFYTKINEAKNKKEEDKLMQQTSNINKEACDRIIKNLIQSKEDVQDNTRKVKKAVPVPDTVHLNWQKSLK